jgi:hypothetical protein
LRLQAQQYLGYSGLPLHKCKVLVTGGRNYSDVAHVHEVLNTLYIDRGPLVIIQGGATGADFIAKSWATIAYNCEEITVKAEWDKYGKAAGHIRNKKMLDLHTPDLVMAFPGGAGTANMTRQASKNGYTVCSSIGWLELAREIIKTPEYKSYSDCIKNDEKPGYIR